MQSDRPANVPGSDRVRSAVSNGTRATLFGDGRSAGARRYRDLIAEFAAEVGGMEALPATGQQVVRRLAQVSVELELMEAKRAAGEAIDPMTFCTAVNTQRRLLRDVERLKPKMKAASSLQAHLASTYGAPKDAT